MTYVQQRADVLARLARALRSEGLQLICVWEGPGDECDWEPQYSVIDASNPSVDFPIGDLVNPESTKWPAE